MERTSLEGLQKSFQEATAKGAGPQELVIKADKQVPHGTVVQIMSLAIEAGIPSINIATRPEVPPSGAP
jgi:biopolymer transport protein ExbD